MSKVLRGLLATRSLWTFWIKIARYLAYRVEIESKIPLKPPYYITRTSSLRIWMKNVYRLLCCSTCLKLSTASNVTIYYQNCTYWVCRPPLLPGLRVTYHYASRWSGWAVTYPTPSHWQWVWPMGPFSVQFCSRYTSTTFFLCRRSAKPWAIYTTPNCFDSSPVWHQRCHFWPQ